MQVNLPEALPRLSSADRCQVLLQLWSHLGINHARAMISEGDSAFVCLVNKLFLIRHILGAYRVSGIRKDFEDQQ